MSTEPDADAFAQRLAEALDQQAESAGYPPTPDRATARPVTADSVDPTAAAVVAQLRARSTWSEPPADLRSRILAAAAEERSAHQSPPGPASEPALAPARLPAPAPLPAAPAESDRQAVVVPLQRRVPTWRRLAVAVPVAAVAAVAFTFAVLAVDDVVNRPDRGVTYSASGTDLAPQADAEVSVAAAAAGFSVVIDAHDLPAAAPGSYYAAFLSGPRGVVPLGSFHARKSGKPITMWSGVDPKDYRAFTVTLQREGGPAEPSDLVVLTASLSG